MTNNVTGTAAEGPGPGMNLSQSIGNDAKAALYCNQPQLWSLEPYPGDDFGYDFAVTCFQANADENANAQLAINLQLKGTTQKDARSPDGKFLSQSIKLATIRMWHNSQTPIVLVVADLIDSRDPKVAAVYYRFLSPELDELLEGVPAEQQTTTIQVPRTQVVHRELDLMSELMSYVQECREARRQLRRERRAAGTETEIVAVSATALTGQSVYRDLSGDFDAFVESLPRAKVFREALHALRYGDFDKVLATVNAHLPNDAVVDRVDAAVCAYLSARAHESIGELDVARALYQQGYVWAPQNEDIAAAVFQSALDELEFAAAAREERDRLLQSMPVKHGPAIACVKARIYALNGDYQHARELLAPYARRQTLFTFIVASIVERDWRRALEEIAEAREDSALRPRALLSLLLLEARAQFELALANTVRPQPIVVIPRGGLPNTDLNQLQVAYSTARQAMLAGQRLSWPFELHLVLDVLAVGAAAFGEEREALQLLASFALSRPSIARVREVAMKMAVQAEEPGLALRLGAARGTAKPFEHEDLVLAIANLKAGNTATALEAVTEDLLAIDTDSDVYLSSLMMLGVVADRMLRNDVVGRIGRRLDRGAVARSYRAILDCAMSVQHSLLKRPIAFANLLEFWRGNSRPSIISHHLLLNADPTEPSNADAIIEVAIHMQTEMGLTEEQEISVAQARITLKRFDLAAEGLENAATRFRQSAEIKSLLGMALDLSGEPARALAVLESLLREGLGNENARRTYVNISIRMGFFDAAERQVRQALAAASQRSHRVLLLQTLFQLLQAKNDEAQALEAVAWELGEICQQYSESEEGMFLLEYMTATMAQDVRASTERVAEFGRRLEAYTERFPNSRYLKKGRVALDSQPGGFLEAMHAALGITNEDIKKAKKNERQMDDGQLVIPFSWRPRAILREIADIFMLWQIRKTAARQRAAVHFSNSDAGYNRRTPLRLNEVEPVINITSLLLLAELDILDLAFSSFQRIVIARATVMKLQETSGTFGGHWSRNLTIRIRQALHQHFEKIIHPPVSNAVNVIGAPAWHAEEVAAMQLPNRVFFCDDVIETYAVCHADGTDQESPSMSVVEFLDLADATGFTKPQSVAEALAKMVRLNIYRITVAPRYLISAIPDELQRATSSGERDAAMTRANTLNGLLDGLWDQARPFEHLCKHFGNTMAYLITNGGATEPVLVALWLRWLQVVRFHTEHSARPIVKLAAGFMEALRQLPDEPRCVRKLWASFWTALNEGFGNTLDKPEDEAGSDLVAEILGTAMADPKKAEKAGGLFNRARLGIEPGTSLYERMNAQFIDAAAAASRPTGHR